ncbi:hypothetical protein BN159_2546 [Streptomyces davaonensis JCM 4913]|uniref:Alpha-glucosidase n=1 Tax=Streptomyces davaonensis (strain DSM 101723 / JCM 4913 / KCC S-0913 / 768) TaxID=1214101 RepID=K4R1G6_STRDJ|nr:glycoside hydrolase family 97 catalytic domain-containing protein [Streptomyces davaonensis]CCK26925.1 hypothetical protein BN159_2546 [Streptomyces davaonensis JCM 4913]
MKNMPRSGLRAAATTLALVTVSGAVATAPTAAAQPGSWTSVQPGVPSSGCEGVRATVALDGNGAPTLGATWNCRQVLIPAPIGLVTKEADYTTGLDFISRSDTSASYTYETTVGKSRVRKRLATETRLVFGKAAARITVHVRTSPDGVALRYELPSGATVEREATAFELPGDAQLSRAPFQTFHEGTHATSAVSDAPSGEYEMNLFAQETNGARVLLAESGVDGGYSGGRFSHAKGTGRFSVQLADPQVVRSGAFTTPWRTAAIGSSSTVVESTLADDVAPESKITDTSWIKPGVAAWAWLDGGGPTQRDLPKLKKWVDYASSQGWPYLMVDDGWKGVDWIPELVAYARERGVRIMLWYHWSDLETDAEREAEFNKIAGWGVAGVKMDFMDSESRSRHQWYDDALADAARHKLVVDLHGSRLPVGVHRTWPHVLTSEAVRGEEYSADRTIEHIAALPFTRGPLGPVDYSPMSFQQSNPNSDGAELALGVLLESGLILPGGRISDYQARPEAQRWLRTLPTVWDETKYVSGDPRTGAVIARRNGHRWFVGAFNRGNARTISYPTTFLGTGNWHAEITTDGPDGLVRTSKVIKAGDTLEVTAVANGGHAVKLAKAASVPTGQRKVSVAGTSHVLDVSGASTADNAAIIRWPSHDGQNQRFEFKPISGGYLRIVNPQSGKDVVVKDASREAGGKAIQYRYETGADTNDEWLAEDAGAGRIRLVNRHSGLYLTAGRAQGDQFEQRPFDGGAHQEFTVD